jgi:hypothetical protein
MSQAQRDNAPAENVDRASKQAILVDASVSAEQAFTSTVRAFKELEAAGISNFQIFNALADLFYKRGRPDVSELMSEAAYRCFQRE